MDLRAVVRNQRHRVPHVVGFVLFGLVYASLLNGIVLDRIFTFGDFPPYYGARALAKFTETWHYQQLGYPYLYNTLPAYLGAVTLVGGALAQNAFFLLLLPFGFVSFLIFGRRYIDRLAPLYLAAGLYALNPLTIGEFVSGGVGEMLGYAGFPLLLHYLYTVSDGGGWRAALKAAAVFGFITVTPWLVFWLLVPFVGHLLYRTRDDWLALGQLAVAGGLGLLLALPSFHHILQRAGQFGASREVLLQTLLWNYDHASPLAVIRLAGNQGMRAMNVLGYNTEPMMLIGVVIPLVALLAWRRSDLLLFYVLTIATAAFMILTEMGYTLPLFDVFKPLWALRNPAKIQYLQLLSLSVLFGAGLEVLVDEVPRGTSLSTAWRTLFDGGAGFSSIVVTLLLFLSLFTYAVPAQGALGLDEVWGDDYYLTGEDDATVAALEGRVLWAPYGYRTQLRLRHEYPNHVGVKSGGVMHGIPNVEYVGDLFSAVASGQRIDGRLEALGVRYVVVDYEARSSYARGQPRRVDKWGTPWLFGNPEAFDSLLAASDAFRESARTERIVVYEVVNSQPQQRFERFRGIHAVYYPQSVSVSPFGPNILTNGEFDSGFDGWWTWKGSEGTQSSIVSRDGENATRMVTASGKTYPLAQDVPVEYRHPYQIHVDAAGAGEIGVFWYDGEMKKENLVHTVRYPLDEVPAVLIARGNRLSVRIFPAGRELLVRSVSVRQTTYPSNVGFEANTRAVPGAVFDGKQKSLDIGTAVAVNGAPVPADTAEAAQIVDAETVMAGDLVFDPSYRQGVGVLVSDDSDTSTIPVEATVTSYETDRGTVVDYWTTGTFDQTPITVLYTAYDTRWQGSTDATHFRMYGWANGFTETNPNEIRWTGDQHRTLVLQLWGAGWVLTALALAIGFLWRFKFHLDLP